MTTSISISAASAVLYHQTDLKAALSILNHDKFELLPSTGTVAEEAIQANRDRHSGPVLTISAATANRAFSMSLCRSKAGAFARNKSRPGSVSFKLNGAAFNRNYKVKPVDYWGSIDLGSAAMRDKRNEQEDRLFSRFSEIPKARRYILDIHVWAPDSGSPGREPRQLFDLYVLCKKFKIPLFVYTNREDFLLQAKKNAVKLEYEVPPEKGAPDKVRPKRASDLSAYVELFSVPVERRHLLSKDAKYVLRTLEYADGLQVFQAALHNAKNLPQDHHTRGRSVLVKLAGIMANLRLTPAGFVHHLTTKWKVPAHMVSVSAVAGQDLDRILTAMATTIQATDEELRSKSKRVLDRNSCYGRVALYLREHPFTKGTLMFFGTPGLHRIEHSILVGEDGAFVVDGSNGYLAKEKGATVHRHLVQDLRSGDYGTEVDVNLMHSVDLQDFRKHYLIAKGI